MNKHLIHIGLAAAAVAAPLLLTTSGCGRETGTPSRLTIPGYRSKPVFEETFTAESKSWILEGNGVATITPDGRLRVYENPGSEGAMLWINRELSGSFLIEYEVELPDTNGMNVVHFCAQSIPGKNFFQRGSERTGRIEEYSQGDLESYQISYHVYTPEGQHDNSSRLRRNPGSLLLSRKSPDPCIQNRYYLIHIAKTGNRIQFFVDKEKVHDLRDRGAFGDVYSEGKLGVWVHGQPEHFTTYLNNIRIYSLIPE